MTTMPLMKSSSYPRLLCSHENNTSVHLNIRSYFHMQNHVSFLTQRKEVSSSGTESRTSLPTPGLVHSLLCHVPLQKKVHSPKFGNSRSRSISLTERLPEYQAAIKIDLYVLPWKDVHCGMKKVGYRICII